MIGGGRNEEEGLSSRVGGVLRIGTLNVRTLNGRMSEVLQLAQEHSLDIVCLQEIRLSEDSLLAAIHAAKSSGWNFLPGSCAIDSHLRSG